MPVIDVRNTGIHVQEINREAATSVLMIHGMFSNLSIYYFNIAPIIAQNFRVVLYDLKSHGMSDKVAEGYDLHSMTDDLLALMNVMGLASTHLVGYSYGGLVALKMAARFPEKIKKLAVIEAPDPSDEETLNRMDMYSKEALAEYIHNNADTIKLQPGKRQLERNHRKYEFLFKKTTMKADMRNERNFFSKREIDGIQHDTLLIYGDASNCIGAGYKLKTKIRKSKLVFVNGDHNIPIQEPLAISIALKAFFEDDVSFS